MSNLSFTKLFSSITDSSVWQESSDVRVVWVTLMAMADPLGRVHAAIPGLARRANVSREATEKALAVFTSPDPDSRSKDHDGRRIEEIPGGWRLLNYSAYRELRDEEARKEQNRLAQSKYRQKVSKIVSTNADSKHSSADVSRVSNSKPASAQEEVEGEVEEVSTKNKQKTSRAASDPRHVPFKLACETYATYKRVEFVWDGGEAKQLAALLAASPGLTLGVFQTCLNHRAKSQVPHGERPREWLGTILKYQEGPLDQYGKPQGASNANRTHSKTGGNIDAARGALAILAEAERNSNLADQMQPEAGGSGEPGDLSDLRAGSIEL